MEIEGLREKIDNIDFEIVRLLDERFEVSRQIGKIKREQEIPVYDSEREEKLIGRIRELSHGNGEECEEVFRTVLGMSKKIQIEE